MRIRVMVCAALTSSYTEATYQELAGIINTYDPDLVLIREVDSATRRSGGIDVPSYIAERTGMHHYYGLSFVYKGGGYGNALLSRFPLTDSVTFSIPPTPYVASQVASLPMITVSIHYRGVHTLAFAGTELYAKSDASTRAAQLTTILSDLPRDTPVIFAGDFSETESSSIFDLITQHKFSVGCMPDGCPLNNPVAGPTSALDYVLFRPSDRFLLVKSVTVSQTIAKGFLPIVVDHRYKPE
jgi:endonuclease/exonuclease/phosphatase family metal-dependent hydrolase